MTITRRAAFRGKSTPISVIAGFLGSGKTTLLKRALAHELDRGVKPAVLMNEFGEVDVDGAYSTIILARKTSNFRHCSAVVSVAICRESSAKRSNTW